MTDRNDEHLEVEQRFATVPEWLLRAPVPPIAKVVYAVIQRYGNESHVRMPSRRQIAEWVHCSRSSVSRAIEQLEAIGAIRVRRDTRPVTGETGRCITNNRYLLRTTDPSIAHVLPAQGGPPVDHPRSADGPGGPPVRPNRKKELQPPPPTPSSSPRSARRVEEDLDSATLAVLDVDDLVVEARAIRRDQSLPEALWTTRAIRRAIAAAVAAGRPADLIGDALRLVAADGDTRQPGRLPHDGPWWHSAEQTRLRRQKHSRAAAAREALLEARARQQAACTRCDADGMLRNFRGRLVHCDHQADDHQGETA